MSGAKGHDLIEALRRRERSAFRSFFEQVRGRSLRLALRILNNREDAEDAVQDAFVILHRRVSEFRGESSVHTWFYRVLVNTCLKARGKQRRRPASLPLEAVPSPTVMTKPEEREAAALLDAEVQRLPLQQRLVFSLLEVEGCSGQEVQEVLGLSAGTVRYHAFQARRTLRERLQSHFKERFCENSRQARPRSTR